MFGFPALFFKVTDFAGCILGPTLCLRSHICQHLAVAERIHISDASCFMFDRSHGRLSCQCRGSSCFRQLCTFFVMADFHFSGIYLLFQPLNYAIFYFQNCKCLGVLHAGTGSCSCSCFV